MFHLMKGYKQTEVSGMWFWLLMINLFFLVRTEDSDSCSRPLGLSTEENNIVITSKADDSSNPSSGRLQNEDGAWCFNNATVSTETAILEIEFEKEVLVSGVASQGPPLSIAPVDYNHLLGFGVYHSMNGRKWIGVNGGVLFFTQDKNNTSSEIFYHLGNSIELAKYVRFVVSRILSGGEKLCLRFEVYGCTTDVIPQSYLQAEVIHSGHLFVTWEIPKAKVTLGQEDDYLPILSSTYTLKYKSGENEGEQTTAFTELYIQNLHLGAEYQLDLYCNVNDVNINCRSVTLTAYPPCGDWVIQENYCYLQVPATDFENVYKSCMESTENLGPFGEADKLYQQKYINENLLEDRNFWLVDSTCNAVSSAECCQKVQLEDDESWSKSSCDAQETLQGICVRNSAGEGAQLEPTGIKALNSHTVRLMWKYKGDGWRTSSMIAKVWKEDETPKLYEASTTEKYIDIDNLEPSIVYSLILKPGFNIITNETIVNFTIIDFYKMNDEEREAQYGGFLCSVPMDAYSYWNGTIRVKWNEAEASSVGKIPSWKADSYIISYYVTSESEVASLSREVKENSFLLPTAALETAYSFDLQCRFGEKRFPCGNIQLTTGLPDKVREKNGCYLLYQLVRESEKWQDAENKCQKRNGHLISLENEQEFKEIAKLISEPDVIYWTGAKLERSERGRWTDGNKINYFPVSTRNSGVTSASESCFHTIQESRRMRIIGANCQDSLPFICKFNERELVTRLEEFKIELITPTTLDISWKNPSKLWKPTYYDVYACLEEKCKKYGSAVEDYKQSLTDLREFTEYTIKIESILKPLKLKSDFVISIMTEPIKPVAYNLTPEGYLTLITLLLISRRKSEEVLEVTAIDSVGNHETTSRDKAEKITVTGLIPGHDYSVLMESWNSSDAWKYSFILPAYPNCTENKFQHLNSCFWVMENFKDVNDGINECRKQDGFLGNPSWSHLKIIISNLSNYSKSSLLLNGTNLNPDGETCSEKQEETCCSFKEEIRCSCCENINVLLCQSFVKVNLGQVENIKITNITFDSVIMEWDRPVTLWTIPSYLVVWRPLNDIGRKKDRGEIFTSKTEIQITELRSEASYEINVTPNVDKIFYGDDNVRTLTTKKDPRIPAKYEISVEGSVVITSPKLKDMQRGDELLDVKVYNTDDPSDIVVSEQFRANDIIAAGVTPSFNYTVITKSIDDTIEDPWYHSFTFLAYPTCTEKEYQVSYKCYWVLNDWYSRSTANDECTQQNGIPFSPSTKSEIFSLQDYLISVANTSYWVNISSLSFEKAEIVEKKCPGDETFTYKEVLEAKCCSFNTLAEVVTCSCCSEEKMVICQKNVPIDLGIVQNYNVLNITYDSITIKWEPPKTLWKIKSYLIMWSPQNWNKRSKDKGNSTIIGLEYKILRLKPQKTYKISVTSYVNDAIIGNYLEDTIKTLEDTRVPLQYEINEDGEMTITSPKFIDMGNDVPMDITLYEINDEGKEKLVEKVIGKPSGTVVTGLTPGANYTIKVNVKNEDENETFNHTTNFVAYPTCKPEQIQNNLECFWVPEEKKPWKEALSLCRQSGGGLVDPSLNSNPRITNLFKSSKSNIWIDITKSNLFKKGDQIKSNCSNSNDEDALCCSYDVYPNGTTGNVDCTCCNEEKSFVCKSARNLNLGQVRNLRISEKLEDSLRIQWDPPEKSWKQLSYLVTWTRSKRKRETNDMLVKTEEAKVKGLKPNTKYLISVSPHLNGVSSGKSVEVDVSTAALNLGEVQNLKVINVTENSLLLRWNPPSRTWNNLAYLVTWAEKMNSRKRRETKEKLVTKNEASVTSLKSNTSYKIGVTPFVDNSAAGNTKEISVTTTSPTESFSRAGLGSFDYDDFYPLMLAKIICCTWITFLVGMTLVIYIVFGMFFQDCLAQICTELALIIAYTCILLTDERIGEPSSGYRLTLCTATAIFLQFSFQVVFLFMLLEVVSMCRLITPCFSPNILTKPWSLLLLGWGIPTVITSISAVVVGNDYVKSAQNCWLDLSGSAMAPTVVPICIFIILQALLYLMVFLAAETRESITVPQDVKRAQIFFSSRWASACIYILTVVAWATGIVGIDKKDSALITAFVVVSFFLGLFILILRVVSDDLLRQRMNDWFKKSRGPHRINKVNSWPAKIVESNDLLPTTTVKQANSPFATPQVIHHQ